jgi:hypothetical protein
MQLGNPAISGEIANPDGDLYENQWEFLMGCNPWTADTEMSPTVTTHAGNLIVRYRLSKEIPYGRAHSVAVSQNLRQLDRCAVQPDDSAPNGSQCMAGGRDPSAFRQSERVSAHPLQPADLRPDFSA